MSPWKMDGTETWSSSEGLAVFITTHWSSGRFEPGPSFPDLSHVKVISRCKDVDAASGVVGTRTGHRAGSWVAAQLGEGSRATSHAAGRTLRQEATVKSTFG